MRPPCCGSGGGIDDADAVFAGASDTTTAIEDAGAVSRERATRRIDRGRRLGRKCGLIDN